MIKSAMTEKVCSKCRLSLPVSKFTRDTKHTDGLRSDCKGCRVKTQSKYYAATRSERLAYLHSWQDKNRVEINRKQREYGKEHRTERVQWYKDYKRRNINFYLSDILRSRLRAAMNGRARQGSAVRDLGCSLDELRTHLEVRFQPGMGWHNRGDWHIDHIKPLAKFDLTDREQLLQACHFTNLQPLWAIDNLSKGVR